MKVIGGSNIASLIGLSPYESAHSLCLRLMGELPPIEDNDAMRWGRKLESRVADMFADGNPEYEVVPHGSVTHPEHDFLIASPDRILLQNGEPKAALEIKTANVNTMREFGEQLTDEIPQHYYCQAAWYAGMLNLNECYVAVYFHDSGKCKGYKEYRIEHNAERYAAMVQTAVRFWHEHVLAGVPPEITEPDAATVDYYKRRERNKDSAIYSDDAIELKIESLRRRKMERKEAERLEKLDEVQLQEMMGNAEIIIDRFTGKNALTFKEQSTTSFDHKKLCADFELDPETIEKYQRKTFYRVLRLAK
jgi:putative phage-type endonuclease